MIKKLVCIWSLVLLCLFACSCECKNGSGVRWKRLGGGFFCSCLTVENGEYCFYTYESNDTKSFSQIVGPDGKPLACKLLVEVEQ